MRVKELTSFNYRYLVYTHQKSYLKLVMAITTLILNIFISTFLHGVLCLKN